MRSIALGCRAFAKQGDCTGWAARHLWCSFLNTVSLERVGSRTAGKQRSKTAITCDRPGRRAHELGLRFGTPLRPHRCSCRPCRRSSAARRRTPARPGKGTSRRRCHRRTSRRPPPPRPSRRRSPALASSTALGSAMWPDHSCHVLSMEGPARGGRRSNRRRLRSGRRPTGWSSSMGRRVPVSDPRVANRRTHTALSGWSKRPRVRDRPGRSGHMGSRLGEPQLRLDPAVDDRRTRRRRRWSAHCAHRSVPT